MLRFPPELTVRVRCQFLNPSFLTIIVWCPGLDLIVDGVSPTNSPSIDISAPDGYDFRLRVERFSAPMGTAAGGGSAPGKLPGFCDDCETGAMVGEKVAVGELAIGMSCSPSIYAVTVVSRATTTSLPCSIRNKGEIRTVKAMTLPVLSFPSFFELARTLT